MFDGSRFTVCDPGSARIEIVAAGAGEAPVRQFSDLEALLGRRSGQVVFAMNAGMYDEAGRPIGLAIVAGKQKHAINRRKGGGNFHLMPNGVFYGTGGEWHVHTTGDFADSVTNRPEFATQSGPMLVIDGKLHPEFDNDGDSKKTRNAVGVDAQGRAHFVISEAPVSFGKLARYYRDVLKTPNALFLDGTVSQLWDPARERMDEGYPLGPFLVVENLR